MRRNLVLLSLSFFALCGAAQEPADTSRLRERAIDEVVVSGQGVSRRLEGVQIGVEQVQVRELTRLPALLGEADVMRTVQLLPGVKNESDASSSFQVRGGTSAQNTLLLDDAPVYNAGHLAGLFSAFNDDAMATATLYKGHIPASQGGATAAVLDLTTRAPRRDGWHGSLGIGLLSAKGAIEGPLGKNTSLLVTARRSYADVFLKLFPDYSDNTLYFYDANARLNHRLTHRDDLQLSLFVSHDKMALKDMVSLGWTNLTGSLAWHHRLGSETAVRTTAYASSYTTTNGIDLLGLNLSFSGYIRHAGLRHAWQVTVGKARIDAGAETRLTAVKSAEWQFMENHEREERKALEHALWAGAEVPVGESVKVQGGLRLTVFNNLGGSYYYDIDPQGAIAWIYRTHKGRIVHTDVQAEPRLAIAWRVEPQLTLKAGYTRSSQHTHALRNQNTSTPFDRYMLSSNIIEPQVADQLSAGLFVATEQGDYDLSLEGYYRHVDHVLDYRDGATFSTHIEMERLVLPGEGRGYGAELCLRKNSGRLTGWAAYTLAWQRTRIDGVNGSRWYMAGNDRRHDVDIVATFRLSPQWTLNATWVYYSGQAFTAPSSKYEIIDNYIYYYAERNGYRTPAYHHLDLGATWEKDVAGGKVRRQWIFGIYNVYNRYNPFLINFEDSQNGARTKAVQYSLFGIVPSATLCLKW